MLLLASLSLSDLTSKVNKMTDILDTSRGGFTDGPRVELMPEEGPSASVEGEPV